MSSTLNEVLRRVRHSRMLLAGIQAESGLDPRLKHSGVTVLGSHLVAPAVIFEGDRFPSVQAEHGLHFSPGAWFTFF